MEKKGERKFMTHERTQRSHQNQYYVTTSKQIKTKYLAGKKARANPKVMPCKPPCLLFSSISTPPFTNANKG